MSSTAFEPHGDELAIIGMAGRFPGARTLEAFWRNLCDGVESIAFFSDEELLAAGADPAQARDPSYVRARGVLDAIEWFDAPFFGLTPREAECMDPQQRLFLECAWEALEHAGYAPDAGQRRVGVYAGASMSSYLFNLYANPDFVGLVGSYQVGLGNDKDHLPTRVSYKLNLTGPSFGVQSACSSSLVAVHMACQSVLNGECALALAGGVSIAVPQQALTPYQIGGVASPDGHCRAFDADANGTVAGNGVGVVVLKRLDEAIDDRDTIYAVIKGSAINNDGALKIGYTAPSVQGQTQVIAEALNMARVDPATIGYVEAHGTGTPLGDPIEIAALTNAYRAHTSQVGRCAIGSLKTNIGHLDAAAGVAGLIKVALALHHKQLPPSLHFHTPNPQIDFASSPFHVQTRLEPWNTDGAPRRAAISSFGIGGTNAHVILEEAPPAEPAAPARPWQLLPLSAKTPGALEAATTNLAGYLRAHPDANLADVAYTLQVGRTPFEHRRILVCRDRDDALRALEGRDSGRLLDAVAPPQDRPAVFLFPGQGAQHVGMGRELYESEPVFREWVDRCAELLRPHLGIDLRDVLYPTTDDRRPTTEEQEGGRWSVIGGRLDQTEYTQPALFVVEYALAKVWMSWGVRPQAMIGHSIGEYVAACLAGVFSLEDALALVAARGRLLQACTPGAMLSVPLSEPELRPLLGPELDLAAVNAPKLCVVAGPPAAIERLARALASQGLDCRQLPAARAFHSALVEPAMEPLAAQVRAIRLSPPQMPYLSNVSGTWITAAEATDPRYWARHLRQPVRFAEGMAELASDPERVLLEVGPGRTLTTLARQSEPSAGRVALTSLGARGGQQSDVASVLQALGQLWLAGVPLKWAELSAHEQRRRLPLPTYPFERQRYWVEPRGRPATPEPRGDAERRRADLADWFYLPSWKRSAPPEWGAVRAAEQWASWLVFDEGLGLGARVAERLERAGKDVIVVAVGEGFARTDARAYRLNPRQRADYDALLNDLRALDSLPQAIVHIWSVTADEPAPAARELLDEAAQARGFYSLLFLTQALKAQGVTHPLRIVVVANQTQEVTGGEALDPIKAAVFGPCKVIPQEYPQITCRSVDILLADAASPLVGALADRLIAECVVDRPERVVAYRGPYRWAQTFEPLARDATAVQPTRLRERGVYLIVGGLGQIGLTLARTLALSVRARLVLVGRSAFPEPAGWDDWLAQHGDDDPISSKIRALRELERHGAEVLVAQADVVDQGRLREVISAAEARFGALHGVIHAAGVLGDAAVRGMHELDAASMDLQLHAKVRGLYALDQALRGRVLDFYLLCSSLASVLGGLGYAAYAAANICMDAFAYLQNRVAPGRWTSVNWDAWDFRPEPAENRIAPADGQAIFQRLLAQAPLPQVAISSTDLQARIEQWVERPAERTGDARATEQAPARHPRQALHTAYVAPRNDVEQAIATIWQDLLGIEQVGVDDDFFELGGHSLLATQIMSRLRDTFHVELAMRHLFETPTVARLAQVIAEYQAVQRDRASVEPSAAADDEVLADLDELSDEDVLAMLNTLLAEGEDGS